MAATRIVVMSSTPILWDTFVDFELGSQLLEPFAEKRCLRLGLRRPFACVGDLLAGLVEVAQLVENPGPLVERYEHATACLLLGLRLAVLR
jgi:hypothetical protein